ncbi:MAG: PKD domain-containing protein [Bacteroidia bacterium]|nr:PKD domain-containing protein [Bacteroidia bacterium]
MSRQNSGIFLTPDNKIGIFTSELKDNVWTNIQPFKHNSNEYMIMHPSLNENGEELFFVSDMSGGYGGTDIYYCKLIGNEWSQPINLGSAVNTSQNEMFPFIHSSGNLYFSSAGHNGLGGLDIFFTKKINGEWKDPEPIAKPINSEFDDFGFITDSLSETGYFSSNRNKSDDIYYFKFITVKPEIIEKCDSMRENNYCFVFFEPGTSDTTKLFYEWDLGDGTKIKAFEAEHCYQKPGYYEVKLKVVDTLSEEKFTKIVTYSLNIEDIEQVYISSVDTCLINSEVIFDGTKTNLKNFIIKEFSWDFGDGNKAYGAIVSHIFAETGNYSVRLQVTGMKDTSGNSEKACVLKNITVINPDIKKE